MIEYRDFAKIIAKKRENQNKSKAYMASIIGINKQRYYRIENGISEPTFIELQIICRELSISLDDSFKIKEALPKHEPHYD
ncbi:MAG: helix-turn-helix transcriptional regulator [Acholeplasmatales bacterium]|nr:helix-turn-helix transcriptional regulator [Acholeplasmatales bacterium]